MTTELGHLGEHGGGTHMGACADHLRPMPDCWPCEVATESDRISNLTTAELIQEVMR